MKSQRIIKALALSLASALALTIVGVQSAYAAQPTALDSLASLQSAHVAEGADRPTRVWPSSTTMVPGQSLPFYAATGAHVFEYSEASWTSSDHSVADVDRNGRVTAVGVGEAEITVSHMYDKMIPSATAHVHVRSVSEEVGIELSETSVSLAAGRSALVNALLAPSLQEGSVTWSVEPSSLGELVTVDNAPAVTLRAANVGGTGKLTARVATGAGQTKEVSIPVVVNQASAADFVVDEKGVLTAYNGEAVDFAIPDGVTEIAPSVFSGMEVENVWVPASVRTIGEKAFFKSGLKTIAFQDDEASPSQLTTLGPSAFGYTNLERIELPRSVVMLGKGLFYDTPMKTVSFGPNIAAGQLEGASINRLTLTHIDVDPANVNYESVDDVLYSRSPRSLVLFPRGKEYVGTYEVLEGTESIGVGAFLNAQITSVAFPSSLRTVGAAAFYESRLTSVSLPDGCESVGESSFAYMDNLQTVDLGGTRSIDQYAFQFSSNLTEVNFHQDLNRLTEIGERAFQGTGLSSVTVPDSVETIGGYAFMTGALTSIHLGAALVSVEHSAFEGNPQLATVTLSPGNSHYFIDGGGLFKKGEAGQSLVIVPPASSVTEFVVPAGTNEIGPHAFEDVATLTRVVLPDGLTTIGSNAFNGCTHLVDLVIPDSVEVVDATAGSGPVSIEYGSQVREFRVTGSWGYMPAHVIVRGGVNATFDFFTHYESESGESIFFGEGVASVSFHCTVPRVVVLPSSVTHFQIVRPHYARCKTDPEVYLAAPEGSELWASVSDAMWEGGIARENLHPYTSPAVSLSGVGVVAARDGFKVDAQAGIPATVSVSVSGGVPKGRQVRVVQINAEGRESVLQDWSDMPESDGVDTASMNVTVAPASVGVRLRVDARDASYRVSSAVLLFGEAPEPDPTPDPTPEPTPEPTPDPTPEPTPDPTPDPVPDPSPEPTPQVGQWVSDAHGWWYRNADGTYPANEARVIGGSTYRFGADGYMRTGWVVESGSWYYHIASGAQATGWAQIGSSWYYLAPNTGAMVTGWLRLGETWYHLDASGAMVTGWLSQGSSWYYLVSGSGAMATGWAHIGGSWYYLSPATGAMHTGWLQEGGHWYYLQSGSGAMATGWLKIWGTWYHFADNGQLIS